MEAHEAKIELQERARGFKVFRLNFHQAHEGYRGVRGEAFTAWLGSRPQSP